MTPHKREVMQMALNALEIYGAQAPAVNDTIEALHACLAQPKSAECDGGQCGIGGYCKQCPKTQLNKKWIGLTDEEIRNSATQGRTDFSRPPYEEFYRAIEAKLKEKNT